MPAETADELGCDSLVGTHESRNKATTIGDRKMALWTVGVMENSLTRGALGGKAAYKRNVRAETRRAAIEKCLPEINALNCESDIRFISVYCGRKGSVTGAAFRLSPTQIDRKIGRIR